VEDLDRRVSGALHRRRTMRCFICSRLKRLLRRALGARGVFAIEYSARWLMKR